VKSNRLVNQQTREINGLTSLQKAASLTNLATTYPMREGTLTVDEHPDGADVGMQWESGPLKSQLGDTCESAEVRARFQCLPGGSLVLISFEGREQCIGRRDTRVDKYCDGSMRKWLTSTFATPKPTPDTTR